MKKYTTNYANKKLFNLIKQANETKEPILIKDNNEKGIVIVGEDQWNSIQETLYLVSQGIDKTIKKRVPEKSENFDDVCKF